MQFYHQIPPSMLEEMQACDLATTCRSGSGGAIYMGWSSTIVLDTNATVYFINNTATSGGAISMQSSKIELNNNSVIHFTNNTALRLSQLRWSHIY